MTTAFMDKGIDMATLKTSLEKLAIDTYSSQVIVHIEDIH